MTSQAYEVASEKMRSATRAYALVRDEFRAGRVGDDEFLAARAAHEAALAEFDVAFAAERDGLNA